MSELIWIISKKSGGQVAKVLNPEVMMLCGQVTVPDKEVCNVG
jgi:hypothetical protein